MKTPAITLLALLITGSACAGTENPEAPPPDMSYYLDTASHHDAQADARTDMIRQEGFQTGFRGGKAQRAWELTQALTARNTTLNALYDFRTLISTEGWLPPVIDEAKDVANISPEQIRTASHVYQIVVPERFVSNPPSWRTWLLAGLGTTPATDDESGIVPKTRNEEHLWREAIEKGWKAGREGADNTLEASFNRLTRDYRGMLLYSTLLRQGFITRPHVTDEQQTVTGNRQKLVTGSRIRRLREHAGFTPDKRSWKPVISAEVTP